VLQFVLQFGQLLGDGLALCEFLSLGGGHIADGPIKIINGTRLVDLPRQYQFLYNNQERVTDQNHRPALQRRSVCETLGIRRAILCCFGGIDSIGGAGQRSTIILSVFRSGNRIGGWKRK